MGFIILRPANSVYTFSQRNGTHTSSNTPLSAKKWSNFTHQNDGGAKMSSTQGEHQ